MESKKLHIGPGDCYLPGWVNIDIFDNVKSDIHANASAIPYPMESFDLIYASHVLEHINRNMMLATLTHWFSLLNKSGVLRLSVPNFTAICDYYQDTRDIKAVMGLLYGGQRMHKDIHCIAFDYESLANYLFTVGFTKVSLWDWQDTEHSKFDDYSQAYLPHMNKETGRLMSLNLEAVK